MKTELINLGYSTKGNPQMMLRFTQERKEIPSSFFTSDGGSANLAPEVGSFLTLFGLSTGSNSTTFTTVVTKAIPDIKMLKTQLTAFAVDKKAMTALLKLLEKESPIQGENVWVKEIGEDADKDFGLELGLVELEDGTKVGLIPVVTRTTTEPGSEKKLSPVQNPSTKEDLLYKELPVYEDRQLGIGTVGSYSFKEEFKWSTAKASTVETTGVK